MITGLFDIGLNSLKVAQYGLEVAGNNVANVETPGYTRRSLVIDQLPYRKGSVVRTIKREINPFVVRTWQDALAPLGYYKVKEDLLNEIEAVFNELDSSGIKKALQEFWDAWQQLSNDASDISLRVSLLERAEALTSAIKAKKRNLLEIKETIDPEIEGLIKEVNTITKRVAELNYKIKFGKIAKQDINSLLDERDELLRKLSEYIGVDTIKNPDSQVTVLINGQAIVVDSQSFELKAELGSDGKMHIIWDNSEDITDKIIKKESRLSALLETRDYILPEYISKLDNFATQLADKINYQHSQGYDLDGNKGGDFFKIDATDPAGSIDIAIDDPKKIAAALESATIPSDNRNALAIISIRDQKIDELKGMSIDDYYNHIMTDIGTIRDLNKGFLELQNRIVENAQQHFDSISGVNLDEEAANVIKFQYMYTASARLISVASKITEVIINMGA